MEIGENPTPACAHHLSYYSGLLIFLAGTHAVHLNSVAISFLRDRPNFKAFTRILSVKKGVEVQPHNLTGNLGLGVRIFLQRLKEPNAERMIPILQNEI